MKKITLILFLFSNLAVAAPNSSALDETILNNISLDAVNCCTTQESFISYIKYSIDRPWYLTPELAGAKYGKDSSYSKWIVKKFFQKDFFTKLDSNEEISDEQKKNQRTLLIAIAQKAGSELYGQYQSPENLIAFIKSNPERSDYLSRLNFYLKINDKDKDEIYRSIFKISEQKKLHGYGAENDG